MKCFIHADAPSMDVSAPGPDQSQGDSAVTSVPDAAMTSISDVAATVTATAEVTESAAAKKQIPIEVRTGR